MRGCSGRPHGYMALPVPAMPCRDGFCFPRRKQGRKGTSTRRAAEVFPCHFQAQEAPLHGAVLHGLRIPEFGRRFSGGFHFPQGSPVNQVRGDFHFMLYLRRLRIYRPPQHQMPASFNAFFHGYLRHASAGFQRVQARGVFHQVGDVVEVFAFGVIDLAEQSPAHHLTPSPAGAASAAVRSAVASGGKESCTHLS